MWALRKTALEKTHIVQEEWRRAHKPITTTYCKGKKERKRRLLCNKTTSSSNVSTSFPFDFPFNLPNPFYYF